MEDDESPNNKRTLAEEEGEDWTKEPPKENGHQIVEREPKRAKIIRDDQSKKRGQRMFGVLMGTLNKFKDEGSKQSDASKRRAATDERLAAKLKAERDEQEQKVTQARQEKQLKLDVIRKEEELNVLDSIYKTRHAAALDLANYLCTSHIPTVSTNASSAMRPPVLPTLPLSIAPSSSTSQKPVYYLPARLLDSQRDALDAQLDDARTVVERERSEWADERERRTLEVQELKEKRDRELVREQRPTPPSREEASDEFGRDVDRRSSLPPRENSPYERDESMSVADG